MATYVQAERPLTVTTALGPDALLLVGFSGQEALSQLFRFELDLLAENERVIPFDRLLGQKVVVHLALADGRRRHFGGIISRVAQGARDLVFTRYRIEMVPQLWLLSRRAQSRIFQQLSVPDILKQVLAGLDVAYDLKGTYRPRDYCVQYRETDLNFASRLMEEEGIFYFFLHAAGGHTLVVADHPQAHPELPLESRLIFEGSEQGSRGAGRVHAWEVAQELRSGKVTLWDHTFELPHRHLESVRTIQEDAHEGGVVRRLKVGASDRLELYDFPGAYAQRFDGVNPGGGDRAGDLQQIPPDGQRTAALRMQEEAAQGLVIRGEGDCRQLTSGHRFVLERHFTGEGQYVVTSVRHDALLERHYRSGGEGEMLYQNRFTCLPLDLPFRPARATPKPFVQGTQTAVVVGPAGQESFTDKYGRVKVQFHWDRQGKYDADSSCWIRVAQVWAGKRWGASFWPRVGQEVVVAFEEGDPDRPIIIGSVYNADQMPHYLGAGPDPKHLNDHNLSGIKTNTTPGGVGFNELRFDDTKGKEQVFLHAERNLDVRVKDDEMEHVLGNRHLIVGSAKDGQAGGDQRELVLGHKHQHVKKDQVEQVEGSMLLTVGGDQDVSVGGTKKETIGGESHLHVKASLLEKVDSSASLTVGQDHQAKVGMKHAVEAGQEIHLKAGMKVILEAGLQLTIKGPGGFVDIGPSGVTIQGIMVLINSGGAAGTGSGSSPDAPKDAQEAKPTAPAEADDARTGAKSN